MSTNEQKHGEIWQFVNDDAGYLQWLEENPQGFVVNSFRQPASDYLILHRATCRHINSANRTNWTTTGFIKTCSLDVPTLAAWAQTVASGNLAPCGACKPGTRRDSGLSQPNKVVPRKAAPTISAMPDALPKEIGSSGRAIPPHISTGCPELDLVWETYSGQILHRMQVLIPDTEDDLNWHAFLGHSIDMQGFRAAEFVGVDPLTKPAREFVPLIRRGIGVPELGRLWEIHAIREHLLKGARGTPLKSTLEVLRSAGGAVGKSLTEALEAFPYRKGHWTVRAYLQNSAVLKDHDWSFRRWLKRECQQLGSVLFPPSDFRQISLGDESLERVLRRRLEQTFYQVGPALAAYMICDWQLWLWNQGNTAVFANFKLDSFHEEFVKKYSRGVVPTSERAFAEWWLSLYPELPPRLANECIWLGIEQRLV